MGLWWTSKKKEDDLDEELRGHLDLSVKQRLDRGETEEMARQAAKREFGNMELVKETTRDAWGRRWAEDIANDVKYGLRTLKKSPGFAAVVILTLAVGIGASTAVFSLVNAVLLRALPYGDADRLVYLYTPNPRFPNVPPTAFTPTNADFFDIRGQSKSYAQMTLFTDKSYNLSTNGAAQRVRGAAIDGNFSSTLNVEPEMGRAIDPSDDQPGREHVALISHTLWRSLFGEQRDILAKQIVLDGQSYQVIGVMPAAFQYPHSGEVSDGGVDTDVPADVWVPLALTPQQKSDRDNDSGNVVARLQPEASLDQAQAELSAIVARLDLLHDPKLRGFQAYVRPFADSTVGAVRPLLRLLLGAVGMVLLVACGNAANLLLARGTTRSHELGVRSALGAKRLRLIRQLLTEAFLLSAAAGALGIALAYAFIQLLLRLNPGNIPRIGETSIDTRVLFVSAAISIFSGILFGLFPAFSASRRDVNDLLRQAGSRIANTGGNRVRNVLIVAQLAMSVTLVAGAGLLIRSYLELESVDTGFSPSTISMHISLDARYQKREQNLAFFRQLLKKLSALPGVQAAGAVTNLPLSNTESMTLFMVQGFANQTDQLVDSRLVTPGYFSAMGTRLVAGRFFGDSDTDGRPPVVIVNEAFAKRFFPGQSAIGKHFSFRDFGQETVKDWSDIVGVVADVRHSALEESPRAQVYSPLWQSDANSAFVAVRTALPPEKLARVIANVVKEIDPLIAAADLHTMRELITAAEGRRRFQTSLLAVFAAIALFLALMGLYGVMNYNVRQRTQEIGIRLALGARRRDVLRLVLLRGLWLTATGFALGIAGTFAFTRLIASLLFGVKPADPATFATAGFLFAAAGIAACFVPASKAINLDPLVALRHE
jgi:predicted permease